MRHELIHAFLYISIHAPTRGATKWIPCCGQSAHISIHAPARGATNSASMMSALSLFQSTLPQGERRQVTVRIYCNSYFNPRSHKGSDPSKTGKTITCLLFQSTLPQGERRRPMPLQRLLWLFQSTLPQGERQQFYTKFHICFISFLPILSPYHISTHSPLPTFNHFLYIFSGANRPEISCLLPFRTKTISGIL